VKAVASGDATPAASPAAGQPPGAVATLAAPGPGVAAESAFREEARRTDDLTAAAGVAAAGPDSLDSLFKDYRERYRSLPAPKAGDDFALIEKADLQGKLIALFFLRERRLADYREIIGSFQEEGPVSVELELLKAALYQRIGQADLRDRAMERAAAKASPGAGAFALARLAFAREIRGYRSFTPRGDSEFRPGEEVLLYGEMEGFRNTPTIRNGSPAHRRSFSVELVLRRADGQEMDRRELLRAGAAVEVVEDAARPVHFWGRYPLPHDLAAGAYRLEIEASDLEAHRRARGGLPLKVR